MKEKKRFKIKLNKRAMVIIAAAAVLVLIFIFSAGGTIMSVIFGNSISQECVEVMPDAASSLDFDASSDRLKLVTSQGVRSYSLKGEYEWDLYYQLSSPYIHSDGNYSIVADIGGEKAYVIRSGKEVYNITSEQPIQSAFVNQKGYSVIISSEIGYKSMVNVYDKVGNNVYKWYSGERYITDAKVSPNSKRLSVLGVDTDGASLSTYITMFDLNSEVSRAEVIIDGVFAYQLEYVGQNTAVLTDAGVLLYDKNGKQKVARSFEGMQLCAFDMSDPSNMVFAVSDSAGGASSESRVIGLSSSLKTNFDITLPYTVTMLDATEKNAVCAGYGNVSLVTKSGRIKANGKLLRDASRIKLSGNGKAFVTVSGSVANIYAVNYGR